MITFLTVRADMGSVWTQQRHSSTNSFFSVCPFIYFIMLS